jgi:hypothetical protein
MLTLTLSVSDLVTVLPLLLIPAVWVSDRLLCRERIDDR